MIPRRTYVEDENNKALVKRMTVSMLSALDLDALVPQALENPFLLWHDTRVFEYPWAWQVCPAKPDDKVLDIGSCPLWVFALMGQGVQDLTAHYTFYDTQYFSVRSWRIGQVAMQAPLEKIRDRLKIFWGTPDQFWGWDEQFDVIYNLSVIEHVEHENQRMWMENIWRQLKPGGKMVMTVDFFPFKEFGYECKGDNIRNHNLSYLISDLGARVTGTEGWEVPWMVGYDPERIKREDDALSWKLHTHPEPYSVYGVVLTKPE